MLYISQGFLSFGFGYNPRYPTNNNTHTGVDTVLGYGKPYIFDNDCEVYKVYRPQEREDNWTGVYAIVEADEDVKKLYPTATHMEVVRGHFSRIPDYLKEGTKVKRGDLCGYEGNFGLVFTNGVRITPEMQDKGDTRAHHCHTTFRPVKRVKKTSDGKLYLTTTEGGFYQKGGCYFEHIFDDSVEHPRGTINPLLFDKGITPKKFFEEKFKETTDTISDLHKVLAKQTDTTVISAFKHAISVLIKKLSGIA